MTHLDDEALYRLAASDSTDAHLAECSDCRGRWQRARALARATREARREIAPPSDVWPGIRARIEARRRWPVGVSLLVAAAAIAFIVVQPRLRPSITQIRSESVREIVDSADATNDQRVERELLDELELRRGELRPETEAAVRASLQTIDSTIAELRAEMARRPNDPALSQLLVEAYAHKVDLMKLLANAS